MWTWKRKANADIDRELRHHFESLVQELISTGVAPREARRRARLEFGGLGQVMEECRDVRGHWLEDFGKDLNYARRTLRRSPGFLAVSVLSLALGIGANAAIFSLINALMLRSLPVKDPQQLVHITRIDANGNPSLVSYPLFEFLRGNLKSLSGAAAQREAKLVIVIDGREDVVNAELVSSSEYSVLGINPVIGRLFSPQDDRAVPVLPTAVISYGYWQRHFGANPDVVGKTLTVDGHDDVFTIIGVTPAEFHGPVVGDDPEIALPLTTMLSVDDRNGPTNNMLNMMGRLAPGVTRQHADAELQVLWRTFRQRVAATLPQRDRPIILQQHAAVLDGRNGFDPLRYRYSKALLVLMGVVALVLLLACSNLSGLLLARTVAREREISIRLAIGASRSRLMRQFLTESFVLAAFGGSAGVILARWLSSILVTTMAVGQDVTLSTAPDWRVLAFTAVISLLACVLAGITPGVNSLRTSQNLGLRSPKSVGHQRLGKALLIAQLSISMVLVTGAALFATTLANLYSVNRGLQTNGILTFTLRMHGNCPAQRCSASARSLVERLNQLPGVVAASAVNVLPISGSLWARDIEVEGYTLHPGEDSTAAFNAIAPKYFTTVETPLLDGRDFDLREAPTSRRVAIVNVSFARHFFGTSSPVGRILTNNNVSYEIIGLVADAKYSGLKEPAPRTVYIPWTQRTGEELTDFNFLTRVSRGDPMRIAGTVEALVRQVDPALRVDTDAAWSTVVDRTIATERMMAGLGGFFGLLALIIGCIGIFGVTAFRVSRRVNEIGLRMALGASRLSILKMVLGESMGTLAVGCIVGTVAALGIGRLTQALLYDVSPADPKAFGMAALALLFLGLLAGWLPARRAARIDPMVALRYE
jgi:predicted permease